MSGLKFNRGELSQALANALGLKGSLSQVDVESRLAPTLLLMNVGDSPYLQYGIGCGRAQTIAAVVTDQGYAWATAGTGKALQIKQIVISNEGAASEIFALVQLSASNITTIVTDSTAQFLSMTTNPNHQALSSVLRRGTHTALIGNSVGNIAVPAGDSRMVTLPDPGEVLYGNDENGAIGFGVRATTANLPFRVSMYGREWPLPV